jgi:hypothetical protein
MLLVFVILYIGDRSAKRQITRSGRARAHAKRQNVDSHWRRHNDASADGHAGRDGRKCAFNDSTAARCHCVDTFDLDRRHNIRHTNCEPKQ